MSIYVINITNYANHAVLIVYIYITMTNKSAMTSNYVNKHISIYVYSGA